MRKLLFLATVVYTVLLIIRPQEFVPGLAQVPLLQIVLLIAFGLWLLCSDKGVDLPQFKILPLLLVFIWLSLGIGGGWWGGIVSALEKMLPPMLLLVIVSGAVRSLSALKIYSIVLIACAATLVYHGHLQVTTGIGWTGQPMIEGRITYTGIFNDPNDMGLLFVLAIGVSILHIHTQQGRFVRLLAWAMLGWLLYGVYLTDSRGTLLATLTVLGLEIWARFGKGVVITLGAIAVPVLVAYTRLAELDASEESAEGRIDAWYEGVQLLVQYPLFGVGWQMFSDHNFLTAHNSIVLAMAELGVLGYTIWLSLVFLSGWMIWRLAYPAGPSPQPSPQPSPHQRALVRQKPLTVQPSPPESTVLPGFDAAAERLAARSLLFAACGFAVGAFFLSQSYKPMLFLYCGLIAGRYLGMREAGLRPSVYALGANLPRLAGSALASIVGMWILVRILL
ncbi:MAG: O-antigen ligase family protein [Pseudomonadota bacterium]